MKQNVTGTARYEYGKETHAGPAGCFPGFTEKSEEESGRRDFFVLRWIQTTNLYVEKLIFCTVDCTSAAQ